MIPRELLRGFLTPHFQPVSQGAGGAREQQEGGGGERSHLGFSPGQRTGLQVSGHKCFDSSVSVDKRVQFPPISSHEIPRSLASFAPPAPQFQHVFTGLPTLGSVVALWPLLLLLAARADVVERFGVGVFV